MRKTLKIFFTVFFLFLFFSPASAADFYFSSNGNPVNVNDEFIVTAKISSAKKINAVSGKIIYPENFLELKEILTGESVINFWLEEPLDNDGQEIKFSGITPGGFSGENTLFLLVFQAKNDGLAEVKFSQTEALINDGFGTPDPSSGASFTRQIFLPGEGVQPAKFEMTDVVKPEPFSVEIVHSPEIFNDRYAAVFEAEDKGVGIDRYEILEEKKYKLFFLKIKTGSWRIAQSPALLNDQKLKSDVYIKAVDKNGNEAIAGVPASNAIYWYENRLIWGIIILLVILVALFVLYAKKKKQNNA